MTTLTVMYRGLLTSCNYACAYCPFAKRRESRARQARDRDALARFTDWIEREAEIRWRILFTPWGEALVRPWYREAMQLLSHLPHVEMVSAQTNLACGLDWLDGCSLDRLAFWTTFHPTECEPHEFATKVLELRRRGGRVSVGAVGIVDHLPAIASLREQLPDDIYLWINAQQPRPRPYTLDEVQAMLQIDPQFEITLRRHRSLGLPCRTGDTTFVVDGGGDMRRCHFVDEVIGNIFNRSWREALQPRTCPKPFCGCYLGVSQLESPSLRAILSNSAKERLPGLIATLPGAWH